MVAVASAVTRESAAMPEPRAVPEPRVWAVRLVRPAVVEPPASGAVPVLAAPAPAAEAVGRVAWLAKRPTVEAGLRPARLARAPAARRSRTAAQLAQAGQAVARERREAEPRSTPGATPVACPAARAAICLE